MNTQQLVKIAKALADPTRHRMLQQIRAGGPLNCSQVCDLFPLSQPTISHHIKLLVEAGLVLPRKDGQFCVLKADEKIIARYAAAVAGPPDTKVVEGTGAATGPAPAKRRARARKRPESARASSTKPRSRR